MDYGEINSFWFDEIDPKMWWAKDAAFDAAITERFAAVHAAAAKAELYPWRRSIEGRLAEVIVLDQFSRNMFRDRPEAFAFDATALVLAQEAVASGHDQLLSLQQRAFLYMPFMHSESLLIHERAEKLFASPGLEGNLEFERKHKAIIQRFGRYPHRNQVLGRRSTAQEIEFLQQPGSSF